MVRPGVFVLAALGVFGCHPARGGEAAPAAPTSVVAADPHRAPRRREPVDAPDCELTGASRAPPSVVTVPDEVWRASMAGVMKALCACTQPGERALVVAEVDFGEGRGAVRVPESPLIDDCLARVPFTFATSGDVPPSDCVDCGPRRYGLFPGGPSDAADRAQGPRFSVTLALDRSRAASDAE